MPPPRSERSNRERPGDSLDDGRNSRASAAQSPTEWASRIPCGVSSGRAVCGPCYPERVPRLPLSVLDLSPISSGSTAGDALRNGLDLARHVEALGCEADELMITSLAHEHGARRESHTLLAKALRCASREGRRALSNAEPSPC